MSNISSERSKMSAAVEASQLIRAIASPAPADMHIDTIIRGVARKLGWSASRARDVWYTNARRIDAEEIDALRAAAGVKKAASHAVGEIEDVAGAVGLHERIERMERMAETMAGELKRLRASLDRPSPV